jgi:uncharacterized lipoprotein YmbA
VAGLAVVLAGCVSLKRTPEARFFVLRPLVEPVSESASGPVSGLVGVLPARLPGHLDRLQVVTWTAPGELRVDEFLRWGEPLDAGITRTTVENLAALLPEDRVVRAPWPAASAPRCRVALDLTVFGAQPDGTVRLEGRWALLPGRSERPLARAPIKLMRGPLAARSTAVDAGAGVEAMSELLADLSREIAASVRALPREAIAQP